MTEPARPAGLRANLAQFSLLVLINALVGAMVGMERSVLPALAEQVHGQASRAAVLSFIVVFGLSKALTNYAAGRWSDRFGRRSALVAGWLVAAPAPFLLMWAPSWSWVLVANVFLGVSQGLTWSTTVIMKIDLAGPARRGLAMGINELAGYLAVGLSAWATAGIAEAHGLQPAPFALGVVYVVLGGGLSALFVRETRGFAQREAALAAAPAPALSPAAVFTRTSFTDRDLSSVCQAGLVNNLNDGVAWGLFPLVYATAALPLSEIGALTAITPAVWGLAQGFTGAASDRFGRKGFIVAGMWLQAAAIVGVAFAQGFPARALAAAALGLGTAMVYPTLLAAIADRSGPSWRAAAVGVYRLWRDLGYAAGALIAGLTADALGMTAALLLVAALTFGSGAQVALRLREPGRAPAL